MNIALLEIYPIYLSLVIWVEHFKNKCINIKSDNMSVVFILNQFSSKDDNIMIIVRHLVLHCMNNNILIRSSHIRGCENKIPDLLSRQQVNKALELDPSLNLVPESIPRHLHLQTLLGI